MHSKTLLRLIAFVIIATTLFAACAPAATPTPQATTASNPGASNAANTPAANNATAPAAANTKFQGVNLRFVGANHPWIEAIKPLLPDFEKQTGIKVTVEAYGEDQLNQKLTTEFTAGNSSIDVFMQRPLQEARVMQKNGWYQDLSQYVNQDPNYDYSDFFSGAIGTETVDKALTGIPIVTEQEVLYYRKDLLEAAGLKVPTTLDELKSAAEKLTDKNKGIYGFVARGQRSPLVTQFSSFLYSYGGDWFNQDTHTATIDTPEALQAMDLYGTLLREYGPPGVLNMSWPQAVAVFSQGKAALYTDASSIFQSMLDPKQSAVADKTGVARFPAGPAGANMYSVTSWGLSMYSGSKNKDAAWEFIKWATSKDTTLKTQGDGQVPSARKSVWNDPQGTANFPQDWVEAVKASSDGRSYDRPLVTQVSKARDIIGQAVVTSIEGGDYKAAAQQANKEFQALLDSEK